MKKCFKEFVIQKEFLDKDTSIIIEGSFASSGNFLSFLPNINLDIPTIQRRSKIEDVCDFKNPIKVRLSDGSLLYFTNDEYRRLHRKPEIGKTMVVNFQRLANDNSIIPSKIISCQIL